MWFSQAEIINNNNNEKDRTVTSSSSNSNSSSSSILPSTPRRVMEDVWKDFSLIHSDILPTSASNTTNSNSIILQDFLAGPFKDAPPPPPPLPPHIYSSPYHHHNHHPIDLNQDTSSHLDPHFLDSIKKQRVDDCVSSDDPRQKRMIKNRESAARSRARKQAYTNELELEVAHLVQENAKLRRQCDELRSAMAVQFPAKKQLYRASSAPI